MQSLRDLPLSNPPLVLGTLDVLPEGERLRFSVLEQDGTTTLSLQGVAMLVGYLQGWMDLQHQDTLST